MKYPVPGKGKTLIRMPPWEEEEETFPTQARDLRPTVPSPCWLRDSSVECIQECVDDDLDLGVEIYDGFINKGEAYKPYVL
jgi:hypothetical protein